MNLFRRLLSIIRRESTIGSSLRIYEGIRYTADDYVDSIVLPPNSSDFPDVSFYQGDIDFDKMAGKTDAIIVRLGQNTWIDSKFERNYAEAKARGLKVGGYWFFDGRSSATTQANLIKQIMNGKSFEMELFIDWERNYGGAYEGLKEVVALMQAVESVDCYDVGLYTGYYWFTGNSNATTHVNQYNYLKNKPLWLAWYAAASNVKVPAPWTELTHWQWGTPSVGLEYGVQTIELDMNSGVLTKYGNAPADVVTPLYDGVTRITGERFGQKIYVEKAAKGKTRVEVVEQYARPSDIAKARGAQVAWNGANWDRTTQKPETNEYSFLVLNDGSYAIGSRIKTAHKFASSIVRPLLVNGEIVVPHQSNSTDPKYTEVHARSGMFTDVNGNMIHITVDGDYVYKGVTLWELASIGKEFGGVNGGDQGGGGDSVDVVDGKVMSVPDDEIGGVHYERTVAETILLFAEEQTMARYEAVSDNNMSVRNDHSVYAAKAYTVTAGTIMRGDVIWIAPADGDLVKAGDKWLQLTDGKWVAIIHMGTVYCTLKDTTPPPPPSNAPSQIVMNLAAGSEVTIKDADGNILWNGVA